MIRLAAARLGSSRDPLDNFDAVLVEPDIKFATVESHEATNLEVGDPPFTHKTLDVATSDAKGERDSVYVQKRCSA